MGHHGTRGASGGSSDASSMQGVATANRDSSNKRKSAGLGLGDEKQAKRAKKVKRAKSRLAGTAPVAESHTSLVDRSHQVPGNIWHHIFTFLPPKSLGRLLSVNKLFQVYLDPRSDSNASLPNSTPRGPPSLRPDAIWQASRRLHWPRMPAPLKERSELDMWRLACSTSCQFCGRGDDSSPSPESGAWHRGPGAKGVSPIFPFAVTSCGQCLMDKSTKELAVLLSPSFPSLLLPALPVVFITNELNVIQPQTLQTGTALSQTQVTKIFWKDHFDQIKAEFESVKLLGSAAAEEWVKGLELRGKKSLVDVSRWGKWDLAGGIHQMRSSISSILTASETEAVGKGLSANANSAEDQVAQVSQIPSRAQSSTVIQPSAPLNRARGQQKRTKEEVADLKAARRAEIERRAMLLDPPIPPNLLVHIRAFKAALQIISPLDDKAWELLKPRLIAQKDAATPVKKVPGANTSAHEANVLAKEFKEVTDEDWNDAQGPLRSRIWGLANEIISQQWDEGDKVKKDNSIRFAAEVLCHVRQAFYAEVAKEDADTIAAGGTPIVEPPQGPWTRKLTLENMKWVFDALVKPRTEGFRKDVFLCNGCEKGSKSFGLEAVIQHYAAKHTTALSAGNVVVYWRAEWPEVPPFNPNPGAPQKSKPNQLQETQSITAASTSGAAAGSEPPPLQLHPAVGNAMTTAPFASASESLAILASDEPTSPRFYQTGVTTYNHLGNQQEQQQQGGPASHHEMPPGYMHPLEHMPHQQSHNAPFSHYTPAMADFTAPAPEYTRRLNAMVKVARKAWAKVSPAKRLPISVKVCVTVHCIAKLFQDKFSEAAPLPMFIDCLSNNRHMRSMRIVNEIVCRVCSTAMNAPMKNKYSLPQLVRHFQEQHVEEAQARGAYPMDWRTDMVLLPDMPELTGLKDILKPGSAAFEAVQDALPWAFGPPELDHGLNNHIQTPERSDPIPYEPMIRPQAFDQPGEQIQELVPPMGMGSFQPEHPMDPRQQTELNTKPALDMGPMANTMPSNLTHSVPNLRPASEVYGTTKTQQKKNKKARWKAQNAELRRDQASREPSVGQPGKSAAPLSGPEVQSVQPGYRSDQNLHSRSIAPNHQGPGSYNERGRDFHDAPIRQYAEEDAYRPGSGPGVTRDWQEGGRRPPMEIQSRPGYKTPNTPAGFEDRNRPPHSLDPRSDLVPEEVIYVDTSGRELGRTTRHREAAYPEGRHYSHDRFYDDARAGFQPPSSSSRYETRSQTRHHDAGYGARYEPHHHGSERPPHRVYYDDYPRHPAERTGEAYELVEARDSHGSYFIRRPVRQDRDEHYYAHHEARPEPRPRASHRSPASMHPAGYAPVSRAAPAADLRPLARAEYDEYDPRYPAPQSRDGPVFYDRH